MPPDEPGTPETPPAAAPGPDAPQPGPGAEAPAGPPPQTPASGRRALTNIARQLTEADLEHPGVQKLLLDLLDRADDDCGVLRAYVDLFHSKDKEAAVLTANLIADRRLEMFSSGGLALGGIVAGLAAYFWGKKEPDVLTGAIALVVGLAILLMSVVARMRQ